MQTLSQSHSPKQSATAAIAKELSFEAWETVPLENISTLVGTYTDPWGNLWPSAESFKATSHRIDSSKLDLGSLFKEGPAKPELPLCSADEALAMADLYVIEQYDAPHSYLISKLGVQLKHSIRDARNHEAASYVVDVSDQTCACEAFNRLASRGACKHIRFTNFCVKNDLV